MSASGLVVLADRLALGWWEWMLPLAAHVAFLAAGVAIIELAIAFIARGTGPRLLSEQLRVRLLALLWTLVLVKVLLPPSLASPLSVVHLFVERPLAPETAAPETSVTMALVRTTALVWLVGVVSFALVLLWRLRCVRRDAILRSHPADPSTRLEVQRAAARIGLRWTPAIRVVDQAHEAAIIGVWRPIMLVPAEGSLSARRREHVILHECMHLRRHDHRRSALAWPILLCLWFHPAVWIARARLAILREIRCDAAVTALLGADGASYRSTLLEVARSWLAAIEAPKRHRRAAGAFGVLGIASPLLQRLVVLERSRLLPLWRRRCESLVAVAVTVVVAACGLPLASPPIPVTEQWSAAQGCMHKRFIILRLQAERARLSASSQPSTRSPS
jgi:beta-lactamase regulating signal transducer with metallopeptidase domain